MSEIIQAIQDADARAIAMEKARENVESAKASLEAAKAAFETARTNFDESLARGEELGLPKAKMRKLIEERTAALVSSGLLPSQLETAAPAKPRPAKPAKKKAADVVPFESDALETEASNNDEDFEMNASEEVALAALN